MHSRLLQKTNEESPRALKPSEQEKETSHLRNGLCVFLSMFALVLAVVNLVLVAEYVKLKRTHISGLQELGDATKNTCARLASSEPSVNSDKNLLKMIRANAYMLMSL